jgi:TPR repeat protein
MASVLILEWYKIRDTLFGHNCVVQDVRLALDLAASCKHPDAVWLSELCAGRNVEWASHVVNMAATDGSPQALCLAWLLGDQKDLSLLRRSAELGYALAQASMARQLEQAADRFKFAQLAAAQGERDGWGLLGFCLRDGVGCERDEEKAKHALLLAAQLGLVSAMSALARLLDDDDPERWRWWGRAEKGASHTAMSNTCASDFALQVDCFNSGFGSAAAVMSIGRELKGHVDEDGRRIFGSGWNIDFDALVGPAKQAIAFYEAQIEACRLAVLEWTKVGLRLGVVKDVRILIAKQIWEAREEAMFN